MQTERRFPVLLERHWLEGSLAVLFAALYAPLIVRWYIGWLEKNISLEHEYFSHGLIGLPFAAYLIWQQREQWSQLRDRYNPWGAVMLGLGGAFYLSGVWDLVNLSLPLVLAGTCLYLKGWQGLKLQAFPLILVLLASPNNIPYLIAPYILPLQSFIAGTAGFLLTQFGIDVTVRQIYLSVGGRLVEVAPHCSGLKMLFTSLYVGLMLLYWRGNLASKSVTGVFIAAIVLISVSANILRNTLLTFFYGTGQDEIFHWLHEGSGGDLFSAIALVVLIPALIGVERLVEQFSPAEGDEEMAE